VNYSQSITGYAINNSYNNNGYDNVTIKNLNIVQGSTSSNSYAIYGYGMSNSYIINNSIRTLTATGGVGIAFTSTSNNNLIQSNTVTTTGVVLRTLLMSEAPIIRISIIF